MQGDSVKNPKFLTKKRIEALKRVETYNRSKDQDYFVMVERRIFALRNAVPNEEKDERTSYD